MRSRSIDDSRLQTQKSQLKGSIQNNQRQLTQIAAQINAVEEQLTAESSLMNSRSDRTPPHSPTSGERFIQAAFSKTLFGL